MEGRPTEGGERLNVLKSGNGKPVRLLSVCLSQSELIILFLVSSGTRSATAVTYQGLVLDSSLVHYTNEPESTSSGFYLSNSLVSVLRFEHRALGMVGKYFATKVHPNPSLTI